jgi:hypothetical protein
LTSEDVSQISQLTAAYAFYTDSGQASKCAELFTDECVVSGFPLLNKPVVGKETVFKMFKAREEDTHLRSCHAISPVHVVSDGTYGNPPFEEMCAKGAAYFQIYRNPASDHFDASTDQPLRAPPDPMHGGGPALVGMYLFTARKEYSRWLLSSWHFAPMFTSDAHEQAVVSSRSTVADAVKSNPTAAQLVLPVQSQSSCGAGSRVLRLQRHLC